MLGKGRTEINCLCNRDNLVTFNRNLVLVLKVTCDMYQFKGTYKITLVATSTAEFRNRNER